MTDYKMNRSPIIVDDFVENEDTYLYCIADNDMNINNNNTCCCCCYRCPEMYLEWWWYYHDTFSIKKNIQLNRVLSNNLSKLICCNCCSNLCQCTYKCYSLNTYFDCCCFTCIPIM